MRTRGNWCSISNSAHRHPSRNRDEAFGSQSVWGTRPMDSNGSNRRARSTLASTRICAFFRPFFGIVLPVVHLEEIYIRFLRLLDTACQQSSEGTAGERGAVANEQAAAAHRRSVLLVVEALNVATVLEGAQQAECRRPLDPICLCTSSMFSGLRAFSSSSRTTSLFCGNL
jgi:hypothetical protein